MEKPIFAVVATPIGNLKDITLRALETLKEVDVIFCEDTRVTKKLLRHYDISTKTQSYHTHSGEKGTRAVIQTLEEGKSCALVTDAGTPGISDPGPSLVARIREHFDDRVMITPIPGADAVSTLLSVAGVSTQPYTFFGFLPTKKGRQTLLATLIKHPYTAVVYESPHRILKLLQELRIHGFDENIIIGRELTKMHEDIMTGTVSELEQEITEGQHKQKGEFVVVIPK